MLNEAQNFEKQLSVELKRLSRSNFSKPLEGFPYRKNQNIFKIGSNPDHTMSPLRLGLSGQLNESSKRTVSAAIFRSLVINPKNLNLVKFLQSSQKIPQEPAVCTSYFYDGMEIDRFL